MFICLTLPSRWVVGLGKGSEAYEFSAGEMARSYTRSEQQVNGARPQMPKRERLAEWPRWGSHTNAHRGEAKVATKPENSHSKPPTWRRWILLAFKVNETRGMFFPDTTRDARAREVTRPFVPTRFPPIRVGGGGAAEGDKGEGR